MSGTAVSAKKSPVGLVVLGAIASGLLLGLLLVVVALAGAPEPEIIGAALLALGVGFVLLAAGSRRFTDQPQPWALAPGIATAAVGLALWALSPSGHVLALTGWVWPALLVVLVAWAFRGARRGLRNWSRRVLVYPALLVLLVVAAGGAFETVAEATSSNTPFAGRTYLVAGHRLYLNCVGHGSPTVVLVNGLGERTTDWAWVQRSLASSARVCAYDRAGEGWSGGEPGDSRLTADLHDLLRVAHVPGPYVLAGHSVGGIYALLYAARYPEQVAGLALIDSSSPYQFDLAGYSRFYWLWRRASALMPSLARAGLVRMASSAGSSLPEPARDAARAFAVSPREFRADRVEFAQLPERFDEAKAITSLGRLPLAVVSGTSGEQSGWPAAQARLARLSRNSTHEAVPGATHAGLLDDERYARFTSRAIARLVKAS